MIINQIYIKSFNKKLSHTFINANSKYLHEKGFIVTIIGSEMIGNGEVCPLKNFSQETNSQILDSFTSFTKAIILNQNIDINTILDIVKAECESCPSLIFGIETAIFDLASKQANINFLNIIKPDSSPNSIKFSNIFNPNNNDYKTKTLKLKIGIQSIEEDINQINCILKSSPNDLLLRLDANQKYLIKDFIKLSANIDVSRIDYIEEPLTNPTCESFIELNKKTPFQYAIDESLYNIDYKQFVKQRLISTIIVKPSIYGSYYDFFDLVQYAQNNNIQLILSSSLEKEIGNMAIIHLASYLDSKKEHGINIFSFYDDVQINNIYKKHDNIVHVDNLIGLGV